MRKVLIPTKLDRFAADLLTQKGYEVVLDPAKPLNEQAAAHPDAEVLIVRSEAVTPEIIDALPKLKLIVRAGAGYNTIDIKYARRRNIDVMNTPGANSNAVAEEVVALMLAVYRHVVPADISTRAGNWEKSKFMGRELTGKRVGIIGLGNIGKLLVKRLSGFENEIWGYDPLISAAVAESLGIQLHTVEEIFAGCDLVSLHIPENNETRGMVDRKLLTALKPGAVLLNCARAGIVNEDDLRAVKAEKQIFYCNDVYPKDSAGPKSIADVADVMLPHLGANTHEANFMAARRAAEQTIAYFEQGVTNCVVNKALPDGLDAKYQQLAYVLTTIAARSLGDESPARIETSFYGKLGSFAEWMTPPIAAALAGSDSAESVADAKKCLCDHGVELVNRPVDDEKKYGESMTIDFMAGSDCLRKASVRGTITENRLMLSRLNNYEGIYLDLVGNHIFVEYEDAPGLIAKIAGLLGEKNINIDDIRAPHAVKGTRSMAIVKTNVEVPEVLLNRIREAVGSSNTFQINYK